MTGCNVENASYGLTICAERNALTRVVAEAAGMPIACVVVGDLQDPLTPCGACRQFIIEFNPAMDVYCVGKSGEVLQIKASELLPSSFDASALKSSQ